MGQLKMVGSSYQIFGSSYQVKKSTSRKTSINIRQPCLSSNIKHYLHSYGNYRFNKKKKSIKNKAKTTDLVT